MFNSFPKPIPDSGTSSKINGVIKSFQVNTGKVIKTGDFVKELLGNEVQVSNPTSTGNCDYASSVAMDASTILAIYRDGATGYGTAVILSIDENGDITAGAPKTFKNGNVDYLAIDKITDTTAIVVFRDISNSNYGTATILSINKSTDSITTGGLYVFISANVLHLAVKNLQLGYALVVYPGSAVVLTYSGTTITGKGPIVSINNSADAYLSLSKQSPTQCILSFSDGGNNYYGAAYILNINNTTITRVGTKLTFNFYLTRYISTTALSSTTAIVTYTDDNSYAVKANILTINGTSLISGPTKEIGSLYSSTVTTVRLDDTHALIAHANGKDEPSSILVVQVDGTGTDATLSILERKKLSNIEVLWLSLCTLTSNLFSAVYTSYKNRFLVCKSQTIKTNNLKIVSKVEPAVIAQDINGIALSSGVQGKMIKCKTLEANI